MSPPPEMPGVRWEPYQRSPKDHIRITETSCCAAYEWAAQGGQFLILRPTLKPGRYEETARGRYRQAREVWSALLAFHDLHHQNEEAARRKRRTGEPHNEQAA